MTTIISQEYGYGEPSFLIKNQHLKTFNIALKVDEGDDFALTDGDCPVLGVELVGFSPNKVIQTLALDNTKFENTIDFNVIETIEKIGSYYPIYDYPYSALSATYVQYLVTDKISNTRNGVPLFYQYELLFDVYSYDNTDALSIYLNNDTLIDKSQYLIQQSDELLSTGNTRYSSTTWSSAASNITSRRTRILLPLDFNKENNFYVVKYTKSVYGAILPQEELIEIQKIYDSSDYSISSNGLSLTLSSKINDENTTLFLTKDSNSIIKPKEIIVLKDTPYQTDKTSSWRMKLQTGAFQERDNYYTSFDGNFYNLFNVYASGYVSASYESFPINAIKPTIVSNDILKINETPIYIDEAYYVYPNYLIKTYDKVNESLNESPGKIAIDVNGKTQNNIKIKSIDRQKGYIQFEDTFSPTDEIEVSCWINTNKYIYLENLELNPKIPVPEGAYCYHISGFFNGFGLCIRPFKSDKHTTHYPYIYDLTQSESNRVCYKLKESNDSTEYSIPWSGDYFTICEVGLNKLTPEILKITDARKICNGVTDNDWFSNNIGNGMNVNENEWYTNIGYYGGEPLSQASTVFIHIPKSKLDSMRTEWINSVNDFNQNTTEASDRGEREFNFYLDQTIRRHLTVGTDYILIPTESNDTFSGILNLEY